MISHRRRPTVAHGCRRLRTPAQRLVNSPSTPKPAECNGNLTRHSGKKSASMFQVGQAWPFRWLLLLRLLVQDDFFKTCDILRGGKVWQIGREPMNGDVTSDGKMVCVDLSKGSDPRETPSGTRRPVDQKRRAGNLVGVPWKIIHNYDYTILCNSWVIFPLQKTGCFKRGHNKMDVAK